MSVTYFSYRFKYVTDAGYVVQNLDTVTPKTWESVQVFTYLLICHEKKMQCQTFQRKPLVGEAAVEVEKKLKCNLNPKQYAVRQILFSHNIFSPSIIFSFLSSLCCIYI